MKTTILFTGILLCIFSSSNASVTLPSQSNSISIQKISTSPKILVAINDWIVTKFPRCTYEAPIFLGSSRGVSEYDVFINDMEDSFTYKFKVKNNGTFVEEPIKL